MKIGSTYDDKTSFICSISLILGTTLAIALPSTANKTQLLNVSTKMTAAKFTVIKIKKRKETIISKWIILEFSGFFLYFMNEFSQNSYTHEIK